MKKLISLLLVFVMVSANLPQSYAQAIDYSNYTKHYKSTFVADGKTYKVEEDLATIGEEIRIVSNFLTMEDELLETQITTVDKLNGIIYFENINANKEIVNSKSYRFDQIVKVVESDEDIHTGFVTYSNNRGRFLIHEEYTINLFGERATALVVGSILAGVLYIAPEIAIPLGGG